MSDHRSVATEDIRTPSGSGAAHMLNKRPRLLSYQGLCSDSRSMAEMDGGGVAGTLSSSLENIMRRRQLAENLLNWQESQVEACRDNILNTVLEHFLTYFHQRNNRNGDERPPANDNAVLVEDEAIRMAISRTGLQSAGPSGVSASSVPVPVSVAAEQPDVQPEPTASWQDPGRLLPDNYILDTAVAAAIQEKGLVACDAEATDSDDSMQQEDGAR
ncbi:uncharacterized protein LOC131210214 [Anopheles bellator]|uniref:uncharacterized protein LOC131210214 n=1 Tax=Anopheles bellator TaxID=139047 RepID=UPI002648CDBC|nr:uncharacterized protein LOC131210214 [Anopheles bellator]